MLIRGGSVVTGDGRTWMEDGHVLLRDGLVADVGPGPGPLGTDDTIIDLEGAVAIPGLINTHTHACVPGPMSPLAMRPLPLADVRSNLDRHLLGGETTILNLCGFCLEEDRDAVRDHPARVYLGTTHLPECLTVAERRGGGGLCPAHRRATAERRLADGAPVIGEIGSGQTLGGGAQDYHYIPKVIEQATGVRLRADQARKLKWAVLGRMLTPEAFDGAQVSAVLDSVGLTEKLSVDVARQLVERSVLPTIEESIRTFAEAAVVSERTGRAAMMHTAPVSIGEIARLAEKHPRARFVASHANSADFEIEDNIAWCRRLRELGVVVDISTWDSPRAAVQADPEKFKQLLAAGVVDTVSTDFGGGQWEPIIAGLALAVKAQVLSLPAAIAMASGNVARVLPEVARNAGLIAPGKFADVVIVERDDIANVRTVIVDGKVVAHQGRVLSAERAHHEETRL